MRDAFASSGQRRRRRRAAILCVAAGTLVTLTLHGQQIWVGGGRFSRVRPAFATLADFDGSFVYCRGFFESVRREPSGSGWSTDYPGADNNFSVRLAELTHVFVKLRSDRQPNHVVVPLNDPILYRCPMLFMEDVGTAEFSATEVQSLRDYFLKGGFLWVDDFWGERAWNYWVQQISRILPAGEFPIFDIPPTHAIMRTLYDVPSVPQVPNIGFWRSSGGQTSEFGSDSYDVHFRGIQDGNGRLMVLMSHNTDIADTWEREGANPDYFDLFSPRGYALGVNVVMYAMTH
jgi:hypothetical protein